MTCMYEVHKKRPVVLGGQLEADCNARLSNYREQTHASGVSKLHLHFVWAWQSLSFFLKGLLHFFGRCRFDGRIAMPLHHTGEVVVTVDRFGVVLLVAHLEEFGRLLLGDLVAIIIVKRAEQCFQRVIRDYFGSLTQFLTHCMPKLVVRDEA